MADMSTHNILLQLGLSGIVTALIIGGKAIGKTLAIRSSTVIVLNVGRLISFKTEFSQK